MKREIIRTADGSTTISIPEWNECYHSKHGAIQEAYHVFIRNGLDGITSRPISILEIGFGTGLNALITLFESRKRDLPVDYVGIEAFPVSVAEARAMNYPEEIGIDEEMFELMHASDWEQTIHLSELFTLTKRKMLFDEISEKNRFDLIYFDAFGFRVQPELWSAEIFRIMYDALRASGVLVTYAARSIIKRNMESAGFAVEKLAGPPGKREMFRAIKN